jgi:hypothetical protein
VFAAAKVAIVVAVLAALALVLLRFALPPSSLAPPVP